jgi:hypothetical protein
LPRRLDGADISIRENTERDQACPISAPKRAPGWRKTARRRCAASCRRTSRWPAASGPNTTARNRKSGSTAWRPRAGPRPRGRNNTAAAA